jgi:CelD/BcsL family acetyltransferase involved in cellulose biosynthesis
LLNIETITDLSSLERLRDEWAALDAVQTLRMPFTSPIWALNWWRCFRRETLSARDELNCYAFRNARGVLVGFAPMFVTHRPGFGPLRLRELQFFGADPYVTEWRGALCHPDERTNVIAALTMKIDEEKPADFIQWRGMPGEIEPSSIPGGFSPSDQMSTITFYLNLPDSWESFRQGLSRNIKESLRKCYNSLARDKHEATLKVVSTPGEAGAALDTFFALHSMRAAAANTINHPNIFDAPHAREFLRSVCMDYAREKRLRIFQLMIADQVVATRIGFVMDDQIFMYFSGYDLAWGRYSVMTTTVAEAIKWSITNKFRIFNLSTGEDVSKTRWRPERKEFFGGYSLYGAGPGRLAIAAIHALRTRRPQSDGKIANPATA